MASAGFTLLELLVVLLIIGLGLGLGMNAGNQDNEAAGFHIRQLAVASALVAQETVLSGATFGLDFFIAEAGSISAPGYRWLIMQEQGWQPLEPAAVIDMEPEVLLPASLLLQLDIDRQQVELEPKVDLVADLENPSVSALFSPEVVYYSSREVTPFTLILSSDEGLAASLQMDLLGAVKVRETSSASRGAVTHAPR